MLTVIDKVKMFREIVNEMADLYEKKNSNYGDSFGQLFDTLGPISGLVPLHNKLDRATSLVKGDKNNFESLEDTFKDLACYAIMNLIEMKVRNQKNSATRVPTTTPGVIESGFNTTLKDSCANCPWSGNTLFGTIPYIGDAPCQWCEHGTKVVCNNSNDYTSTTIDSTDNIKTRATSSTGLEDAFVRVNPSIATSTMIDEHYDIDANVTEESGPVKVYKSLHKTK